MKTRVMNLADIQPADYNPRAISVSAAEGLKASVKRWGLVQPLVWNERTRRLVGGHQRLTALLRLGKKKSRVVVVNLPEAEEKALNVALNAETIQGNWTGELAGVLDSVEAFDAELFDALNFGELEPFSANFAADDGEEEDGGDEEEPREDTSVKGSLRSDFGVPTFSVLDARSGEWSERKNYWKAAGVHDTASTREGIRVTRSFTDNRRPGDKELSAVSLFDPVLAEIAYAWFAPPEGRIGDPFAGGLVRGAVASCMGFRYFGVDVRAEQIEENYEDFANVTLDRGPAPEWVYGDSLEVALPKLDFVFSCPPYLDLERYSDDPRDLSAMDTAGFLDAYRGIISRYCGALKNNRFAAFVVGEVRKGGELVGFVDETVKAFKDAGTAFYNSLIVATKTASAALRARRNWRTKTVIPTHQHLLVFVKGDPKKAAELIPDRGFAEPVDAA